MLNITAMHVRGVHLGSFWNVNQPDQNGCPALDHNSAGQAGYKNDYHIVVNPCSVVLPFPGTRQPQNFGSSIAVYFEADSKWDSQWDGLLINLNKRLSHHFGYGLSYTWSKGIDNGPNPSFVLIPQDSCCFNKERAISSDGVGQRFVANAILSGPEHMNILLNGWTLSTIVSLQSPNYFTKFAGFDSNGDVFGNNDRVGIEARNTFQGDSYQSVDLRVSRNFKDRRRQESRSFGRGFQPAEYSQRSLLQHRVRGGGLLSVRRVCESGKRRLYSDAFGIPRGIAKPVLWHSARHLQSAATATRFALYVLSSNGGAVAHRSA